MMSDAVETPPPTSASMDSIDPHTPTKDTESSSTLSSRVNKKYLKLGIVGLAVVALIIGLSVGLTNKNKANNNVTASKSNVESMFDVFGDEAEDCAEGFSGSGKSGKSGSGSEGFSGSGKSGKSGSGSEGFSGSGKSGKSGSGSEGFSGSDSGAKSNKSSGRPVMESDQSSKSNKGSGAKSNKADSGAKSSKSTGEGIESSKGSKSCSNLPDICEESGFGPSGSGKAGKSGSEGFSGSGKSGKSGSGSEGFSGSGKAGKSGSEGFSGSSKSDKESGASSSKSNKESGASSSKSNKEESASKSGKGSKSAGGNLIPTICSPTPTPGGPTPPSGEISTFAPTYAASNVGTPESSIAGTPGSTPTVATESEYEGSEQTGSRGPDVP